MSTMLSGVNRCLEPSICDLKNAPSFVSFLLPENENTWYPPLSVSMGLFHDMKLCSPPAAPMYPCAWPQIEVICITQNYLCINILCKVSLKNTFHGACRSHRHKDRSRNITMLPSSVFLSWPSTPCPCSLS